MIPDLAVVSLVFSSLSSQNKQIKTHLPQHHDQFSCQKGTDATLISTTTRFVVRRGQMQRLLAQHPILTTEGVRCGTSQKRPPRDSTNSTALSGLLLGKCHRLRLISLKSRLQSTPLLQPYQLRKGHSGYRR